MSERDETVREFSKTFRPGDSATRGDKQYGVVNTAFGYRFRPTPVEQTRDGAGSDGENPGDGGDASE